MRPAVPARSFALLLLAAAVAAPAIVVAQPEDPTPPLDGETAQVVRVVDGDTIRVQLADGTEEPVRYIGIDTPELGHDDEPAEPYAGQAAAANAQFVEGQTIMLETDVSDRDRFDRLLRYVWVDTEDGPVMVNERMVALGLADVVAHEPDTRHHQYLTESLEQARFTGRGMHDEHAIAHALVGAEVMAYLLIDAYDAHDIPTLRRLMDRDVVYTLPGDVQFVGRRNVLARFREEWNNQEASIAIRGSIGQPEEAMLELTITTLIGEDPGSIDAVGVQRWRDDRLVDYRLYREG